MTYELTESQRWLLLNALHKETCACEDLLRNNSAAQDSYSARLIQRTITKQIIEYRALAELIENREVIELR